MYVPRGYERFSGRRRATVPVYLSDYRVDPRTVNLAPASQAMTVGSVAAGAAVPIVVLGFVGLVGGAVMAWKFVRAKGWGR